MCDSKEKRGPNPIDVHVGNRVKTQRTIVGMSQEVLGDKLGVTFQQVQKYEKGSNRIGASRLYGIATALSVPVSFFFEGLTSNGLASTATGFGEAPQEDPTPNPLESRESIELNRAFARISDPKLRKALVDMAKSMADAASAQ